MSRSAVLYELTHVFCVAEFPGYMIRVFDDGELINHSDQPTLMVNTSSGLYEAPEVTSTQDVATALLNNHFTLIASRDIEAGEELTLDYNADPDDPQYYSDLCEEYGVSWEWL
jgi:SET domain-containing protein